MSNKHLLGIVLGLCTLGGQLEARVRTNLDSESLTGRYASGADSMALSVDDLGQVEGFYVRAGAFGEISGKLINGVIVGSWMESSGAAVCSNAKRGYSSWGPVEASLNSEGVLAIRFGACEDTDVGSTGWILQRKD